MTAILLLFLVGIVLLGCEVFLPGAVVGIIGGVTMLGGCVLAFDRYGPAPGVAATAGAIALLGLTLYAEFALLPKTRFGKKMFVHGAVRSTSQPPLAPGGTVLGKVGTALTTLAPSGYILLDGQRYEAFSQSGLVSKGSALRVVGLDNFRLIVSQA